VPLVSADLPLTGHSDDCMDRGTIPLPCNCGADLPLAGDELATIKARAEAATPGPWEQAGRFLIEGRSAMLGEAVPVADVVYDRDVPHIAGMDPETTLRLVAEVERLRAVVTTPQPVTADELAAIDAWLSTFGPNPRAAVPMPLGDALRLVAEVERLRAQVERVKALAEGEVSR
jgi:hypothetical protein